MGIYDCLRRQQLIYKQSRTCLLDFRYITCIFNLHLLFLFKQVGSDTIQIRYVILSLEWIALLYCRCFIHCVTVPNLKKKYFQNCNCVAMITFEKSNCCSLIDQSVSQSQAEAFPILMVGTSGTLFRNIVLSIIVVVR